MIIWRKQTNKPTKYLGSGTLPVGAYVTLEHESILTFRKGTPRVFEGVDKAMRQRSSIFWEERNAWFSDIWEDLKGVAQGLNNAKTRKRSGAFPYELAYRLINMYSVIGDTILDPFLGTGTTTAAALSSARNSVAYEIDTRFEPVIMKQIGEAASRTNDVIAGRVKSHLAFIKRRIARGKKVKHKSKRYGFPVVSRQEIDMAFYVPDAYRKMNDGTIHVDYAEWSP
jgi:DNA modification methylase